MPKRPLEQGAQGLNGWEMANDGRPPWQCAAQCHCWGVSGVLIDMGVTCYPVTLRITALLRYRRNNYVTVTPVTQVTANIERDDED